MEAGLAGSDPLLLTRLMGQLVVLLQTRSSKRQQLYSEWVPLQAYLALLQAHAQFATAGTAVLDAESIQVVQSAQQPHYRCRTLHLCVCAVTDIHRLLTTGVPTVMEIMCSLTHASPSLAGTDVVITLLLPALAFALSICINLKVSEHEQSVVLLML